MYKKVFIMSCVVLYFTLILLGCGKENQEKVQEKNFGIICTSQSSIELPEQVVCDQEGAWCITTVKNDFIYGISMDDEVIETQEIEWQSIGKKYDIINIVEQNGILYAQMHNKEENTLEIYKHSIEGSWNAVTSLEPNDIDKYTIVGTGFYVDSYENVYLVSENTIICFSSQGQELFKCNLNGKIAFLQENFDGNVECVTIKQTQITLYQLTGNNAEEKWTTSVADGWVQGIPSNDNNILCLATSTEILFIEKVSGDMVAKTSLVKLGVATVLAGYYNAEEETLQLYSSSGDNGIHYTLLSEGEAVTEQRTELVYGVIEEINVDASSSIRTAIHAFNQENENYYITIKNYSGRENLDRLHADMAAGNGPDIIDMMYCEYYESYVKNGYLEDLSPYLEQSQYKNDIIWNVLDTYKVNGGLYLMVPQFQLEGLVIHPDYASSVERWDKEAFSAIIKKNAWEKDVFGNSVGDPQMLLYYMMCGRQEEFINWEQKTASFDTQEFMDMLTLCKEYADKDWSDMEAMSYEEQKWNTLCKREIFGTDFWTYLDNVDMCGREYSLYGYPTLSGHTYGITACTESCAIYSGSKHKDGAWEFIESLLQDSNQKYRDIAMPGFPIRCSILSEMAEESKKTEVRLGEELLTITDSEISILEDIIYNGELSNVLMDPNIWAVIQEEAVPYFAGDKSVEETVRIIQSRTQIVLSE